MHSRAPHLEGRYTKIGRVTAGMDIVDALIVGDTIEQIGVTFLPSN
jgi:cyclophilin family peptidyl-prolyl cis-trans isomerase